MWKFTDLSSLTLVSSERDKVIWKYNFEFLQPFPGIKRVWEVWKSEEKKKTEILSSSACVVHATAKRVISRRWLDENGCELYSNEKRACAKLLIPKFVTFLSGRRRRIFLSYLTFLDHNSFVPLLRFSQVDLWCESSLGLAGLNSASALPLKLSAGMKSNGLLQSAGTK